MPGAKKSDTAADTSPHRCFFMPSLWLVTLAALILRLAVSWELAEACGGINSVMTPSKLSDLATYTELSRQIANGSFKGEFYYQPYYYSVFLPCVRYLSEIFTPVSFPHILLVCQSLAGALTVFVTGLTGGMVWGRAAGVLAAALTAISTPLLLYTPYCQNETLQTLHLALLTFFAVKMLKDCRLHWAAAAGLLLGISAATRGNAVLFLPGIAALWICQSLKIKKSKLLTAAGLLILCISSALPQIPFAVHNTIVTGRLCGPSTAANAVLALGNTPEAPAGGRNPGLPAGAMEYPETWHDFMARTQNSSVPEQMWSYLREKPLEFMELQFRKLLLFWDYPEIPNNVSLYGDGEHSRALQMLLPGRSAVILSLGLAGMFMALPALLRRPKAEVWLLYYMVICYWLGTAVFYILSRFRAPILPEISLFAGYFAAMWLTRRERKIFYTGAAALLTGLFITVNANSIYRTKLECAVMRAVRPDGTVYRLKDGRILRLDHGPYTGGGWEAMPLHAGMKIEKYFRGMPGKKQCEIEWSILSGAPGSCISGTINGVPFSAGDSRNGLSLIKCSAPVNNGHIAINIEQLRGEYHLLYDRQRNYRPELQPGELILRLRYR